MERTEARRPRRAALGCKGSSRPLWSSSTQTVEGNPGLTRSHGHPATDVFAATCRPKTAVARTHRPRDLPFRGPRISVVGFRAQYSRLTKVPVLCAFRWRLVNFCMTTRCAAIGIRALAIGHGFRWPRLCAHRLSLNGSVLKAERRQHVKPTPRWRARGLHSPTDGCGIGKFRGTWMDQERTCCRWH